MVEIFGALLGVIVVLVLLGIAWVIGYGIYSFFQAREQKVIGVFALFLFMSLATYGAFLFAYPMVKVVFGNN